MSTRLRSFLWAALTMLAIVGVSTAWSMDSPVGAAPDEVSHIVHAYGVATGQTLPTNETLKVDRTKGGFFEGAVLTQITVPASLLEYQDPNCYIFKVSKTPSCGFVKAHPSERERVTLSSYMTRYPPLYYVAEGAVLRLVLATGGSGHEAMLAARIASGAMCLALVGLGAALLRRRFPGPGPALMVLASLTPVSLSLFSSVNPNGLEIAAAVLTASFVCVLRDDYRDCERAHPWLLVGFVVSLAILTWTRPLSLVWAGLLLGLLLLPGGALPALRRRAPDLAAVVLAVACLAAATAWLVYSSATRTMVPATRWSTFSFPVKMVLSSLKFGDLIQQMIGLMGSDTVLPPLLVLTWSVITVLVLSLFALGARRAATSLRHAMAFLLGSMIAVGGYSVLTAFGWQGRYWLPAVAAALVLCVPSLQGRHLGPGASKRLTLSAVVLILLMQTFGFLWHQLRYVYGVNVYFPRFDAIPGPFLAVGWQPPLGRPLTLALLILGSGLLGLLLLRGSFPRPVEAGTSEESGALIGSEDRAEHQ